MHYITMRYKAELNAEASTAYRMWCKMGRPDGPGHPRFGELMKRYLAESKALRTRVGEGPSSAPPASVPRAGERCYWLRIIDPPGHT
jgi:hypothetical protein